MLVDLLETRSDGTGNTVLDGLLDETGSERANDRDEERVLGVADLELERVDLDGDTDDIEGVTSSASGLEVDLTRDTLASEKNVGDTRVRHLGETRLLLEVERYVPNVGLDLRERKPEGVLVAVLDVVVWRQLEVVLDFDFKNVGQDVLRLEGQVLNDKVDGSIGVLDTRDRNVADLASELRNDDRANVVPQVRLDGEVAIAVKSETLEQALEVFTELLVLLTASL